MKEAPSHLFSSRESGGGSRSDRQDHPGKPSACRRARSWKMLDLWKATPLQASAGEAAAGTSGRGPPGACSPLSPAPRCSPLPAPAGHTRGAFSRPTTLPGASRRAHGKAGSGAWKAGVWQLAGRPGERLGGSAPSLPACSPVPVPCLALVAAGGNKAKDRPSRRPLPRWGGRARPPGCGCRRDARSASAAPHRAARPRPLSVPLPLLPRLRGGQKGAGEGETFLLVLF